MTVSLLHSFIFHFNCEGGERYKKKMNKEKLKSLINLKNKDYDNVSALDFENLVCFNLKKHGRVLRQIWVQDRGDARKGRIDIVFHYHDNGELIPIEIDRRMPRIKSMFKVRSFNHKNCFVITRSPYEVFKV